MLHLQDMMYYLCVLPSHRTLQQLCHLISASANSEPVAAQLYQLAHTVSLYLQGKIMKLLQMGAVWCEARTHISARAVLHHVTIPSKFIFAISCQERSGGNMISIPAREYNCQHGSACEMHTAGNSYINIYIHFGNTDIFTSPRGPPSLEMHNTVWKNAELFLIIQPCVQSKGALTSMVTLPNGKFATHATCWHWLQHWPFSST